MRCHEDRHLLKTWILESAPQPLIPHRAEHASEIQIVKNQYVRNAWCACCVLSHGPSRWPFKGQGRVHVAMRVMQAILTSRCSLSYVSLEHAMTSVWQKLPHAVALAIALVMLGSCADLSEFRTDIAHLRSDLHANTQVLSQLSARMDELERRQGEAESDVRQTQQDLSQAIEVLARKALITKGRQITRDSGKSQSHDTEKPEGQARERSAGGQGASSRGGNVRPGRRQLSLGMTQDDVRRMLGEPIRSEPVGAYVFWHYSPMSNQQYVIFEKMSGQVSGWRGL